MQWQDVAAGARLFDPPCQIAGAVTDQWNRLLAEGRHHHLSDFAIGDRSQRIGIQNLQQVVVGPVVNPLMPPTIQSGTWAVQLGQAGDVEHVLKPHEVLDPFPHGIAASLGPEDHFFQRNPIFQAPPVNLFGHQQPHGGGTAHNSRLEVHEELALQIDVARSHGNGHGTQPFAPQLESDTGGPDPVADGDLNPILWCQTCQFVTAGKKVHPVIDIFLGVRQHFLLSGGS